MSVQEAHLIQYGEQLSDGSCEIEWRTSVGRSYYGAFHLASKWHDSLGSPGVATPGKGMHASLIECLKKPSVGGGQKTRSMSIGYLLETIKPFRTVADYHLAADVDRATAINVAAFARKIESKV